VTQSEFRYAVEFREDYGIIIKRPRRRWILCTCWRTNRRIGNWHSLHNASQWGLS